MPEPSRPPWTGTVDAAFGPVRDAFRALLDDGTETGAALSVRRGTRVLVDLAGGWADAARTRPFEPDTLVGTFSVAKPFSALTTLTVLAGFDVDVDAALSASWPAYAAEGKAGTTWRHCLTHASGQLAFPADLAPDDLFEPVRLEDALAAAPAEAPGGAVVGEHCLTYGHLLGGGVRALTGAGLGPTLRNRLARPLGWDVHLGVPALDLRRVAELETATVDWAEQVAGEPGSARHRALTRPPGALDPVVLNSVAWRTVEFGAIGLHATARGLTAAYADWASHGGPLRRLLGERTWRRTREPEVVGQDVVLDREAAWTLACQVDDEGLGMGGIGGSAAWYDARHGLSIAYVTRRLADHARADAIEKAVLGCL